MLYTSSIGRRWHLSVSATPLRGYCFAVRQAARRPVRGQPRRKEKRPHPKSPLVNLMSGPATGRTRAVQAPPPCIYTTPAPKWLRIIAFGRQISLRAEAPAGDWGIPPFILFRIDGWGKGRFNATAYYGSSSPACTFTRSFVQARACNVEVGKVNLYGVS